MTLFMIQFITNSTTTQECSVWNLYSSSGSTRTVMIEYVKLLSQEIRQNKC